MLEESLFSQRVVFPLRRTFFAFKTEWLEYDVLVDSERTEVKGVFEFKIPKSNLPVQQNGGEMDGRR